MGKGNRPILHIFTRFMSEISAPKQDGDKRPSPLCGGGMENIPVRFQLDEFVFLENQEEAVC